MPKTKIKEKVTEIKDLASGIASRTRSKAPPKPKAATAPKPAITKDSKDALVDKIVKRLKQERDKRHDKTPATLALNEEGVCTINTGRMAVRSQHEVYTYAYLVNEYIKKKGHGKVKVKSTGKLHKAQQLFCNGVRSMNRDFFSKLNAGKGQFHKMFSVVAHVPDECIQVRTKGESHNQVACVGLDGMGQAPGWLPMTRQANGLVAQIFGKGKDQHVTKLLVDGEDPECMLPIPAWEQAKGKEEEEDEAEDMEEEE